MFRKNHTDLRIFRKKKSQIWGTIGDFIVIMMTISPVLSPTSTPDLLTTNVDQTKGKQPLYILSAQSNEINMNLSQYDLDESDITSIMLPTDILINITLESTGEASFDVSIIRDAEIYSYINQETTTEFSDEFLQTTAVPFWGNYNSWDSIDYSNRVSNGINLDIGETKSLLMYIDSTHPMVDNGSMAASILTQLKSTNNPYNNTLKISWEEISLASPDVTFEYSNNTIVQSQDFAANSVSTVVLESDAGVNLTQTVLNQSISANASLVMIAWEYDLSGNLQRSTTNYNGLSAETFVPEFQDLDLSNHTTPGIIINDNANIVNFQWNFTAITDTTVNYSRVLFENTTIQFSEDSGNEMWIVMDMPSTSYFELSLVGDPDISQIGWDVAAQFYTIGKTGSLFTLDASLDGEVETVTIFTNEMSDELEATTVDFQYEDFQSHETWWAVHNTPTTSVNSESTTQTLGMKISATYSTYFVDFNCTIRITEKKIKSFAQNSTSYIGADNGTEFEMDENTFEFFTVESFEFQDFDQNVWEVQSINATSVEAQSKLYCNDPLEGDKYPNTLNNSLISELIDASTLSGTISLSLEASLQIRNNDGLGIYIQNSTDFEELGFYSDSFSTTTLSFDISDWIMDSFQIILNFTALPPGNDFGPIIDDVKVSNTTNTVFLDDFEGDLVDHWTQVDNSGENLLYWRIDRDTQAFNSPQITVLYPNSMSSFQGYAANPYQYTQYTKMIYGNNPYVQPNHTGYLIIEPSATIVQNMTVNLGLTTYGDQALVSGMEINADYNYTTLEFQSGFYWEYEETLPDIYPYYSLAIEPEIQYEITFRMENVSTIILDCQVYNNLGQNISSKIENFYGFFMVNHSYFLTAADSDNIFIKFDALSPDAKITVEIQQVDLGKTDIPWEWIIVAVLGVSNALTIGYLAKMKIKSNVASPKKSIPKVDD